MAKEKEHLNLVVIGHIDHGKSTTVGRLMFDSGNVPENQMRKLKEMAVNAGKDSWEFAYVMDNLKEERERGITIDLAHKKFSTPKYDYTMIDAPGHRDFVKNMITGASQADCGCLVVAAADGVMAQTKEHVFLARTMGVNQLMVIVNKMDTVNFDQAKFEEVKKQVQGLLTSVGYKLDQVQFIPTSGLKGDNVFNKSEHTAWYDGPTMFEQLDNFTVPEKPTQLPLRLPIQDVYNITGIGVVPVGRVETGIMKTKSKIVAVPGREGKGVVGECKTIEMHHEQITQAEPGDNIGFSVGGIGKKDLARGDVIGSTDSWPTVATEFTAHMVVLNHPTVVTVGYTPVFHINTAQVACQIIEIVKKMDSRTGEEVTENKDVLRNGDAAIVKIRPTTPLVIEKQSEIPQLARFAIRDSGTTVAAGMCIELVAKDMAAVKAKK
ncbi:translation elongation factor EF-1 subunit alpha [archaeon]|jgi:elongation factor 1-alpha|nr:translation elongation factor EF-1 subunit alpha [archaeon]MBT4021831.1 translation elongation factor EF-1 subunit alpha [archaeon]MBT4272126.1 translation elongation factor EF-1 subunit alpha [archaeon]MBT4460307.1 translation elongation factor EF-1 subunit alpha [archaeon]MBT4858931.1 translation elongation factor EF-1 subunit alpha [archaeon]